MKRKSSEVWVGIFVVIGILILAGMTLKIEKFRIGKEKGYLVYVNFDSAGGLDKNAPVRVAGVHVGNVERVALEQGKAKVALRLPKNLILYKDAKGYLKTEGFLGERYVEVTPGTAGAPRVEPNGEIEQGAAPADIETFIAKMSDIGEDIKAVTKPLGQMVKSVDPKKMGEMIDNLNKFSGDLTTIAKDSEETIQKAKGAFASLEDIGEKVKKGEGTLGKLITDDSVYQEAKKTVEAAKEAAESLKGSLETLKTASEKIEKGEGSLGKLIQDESLYQEAKEAIQSVKGFTEKLDKGEGTLGKLISDDTLAKEAEKTMKKIQKAAEGIEEQTPITVLGTIFGLFF
jgi:phospholipid/cholesterol/gamma-HCH transport system substrate-binding protein